MKLVDLIRVMQPDENIIIDIVQYYEDGSRDYQKNAFIGQLTSKRARQAAGGFETILDWYDLDIISVQPDIVDNIIYIHISIKQGF